MANTPTLDEKKLAALIKKAKSTYKPEDPMAMKPVVQMVTAFFMWEASTKLAEKALDAMFDAFTDINEIRVTRDFEIVEAVGEKFPLIEERVIRFKQAMNTVFEREHGMEIKSIASAGKKDQKAYLDTIPGLPPYVGAQVLLLSFGGHAMPVDDRLVALLVKEGVLSEPAAPEVVEALLLRSIRASDAVSAHIALQALSDDKGQTQPVSERTHPLNRRIVRQSRPSTEVAEEEPAKTKRSTKKTTTKKSTTKKSTTKKSTTKKSTTKKSTTKTAAKTSKSKTTKKKTTKKK